MKPIGLSATLEEACALLVEDGRARALSSFVVTCTREDVLRVFSSGWRRSADFARFVRDVQYSLSRYRRAVVRGDVTTGSTNEDHDDAFASQWLIWKQPNGYAIASFDRAVASLRKRPAEPRMPTLGRRKQAGARA